MPSNASTGQPVIAPGTWNTDPSASSVRFQVPNFWGLAKVKGSFDQLDGVLIVGEDGSSAVLGIDATSVNTKNDKRDVHLRSADFFDVDNHPQITFQADEVTHTDNGLVISGELTIRGNHIELELPVEVQSTDDGHLLRASTKVSREAAGLNWNRAGMVGSAVDLDLELAIVPKSSTGSEV